MSEKNGQENNNEQQNNGEMREIRDNSNDETIVFDYNTYKEHNDNAASVSTASVSTISVSDAIVREDKSHSKFNIFRYLREKLSRFDFHTVKFPLLWIIGVVAFVTTFGGLFTENRTMEKNNHFSTNYPLPNIQPIAISTIEDTENTENKGNSNKHRSFAYLIDQAAKYNDAGTLSILYYKLGWLHLLNNSPITAQNDKISTDGATSCRSFVTKSQPTLTDYVNRNNNDQNRQIKLQMGQIVNDWLYYNNDETNDRMAQLNVIIASNASTDKNNFIAKHASKLDKLMLLMREIDTINNTDSDNPITIINPAPALDIVRIEINIAIIKQCIAIASKQTLEQAFHCIENAKNLASIHSYTFYKIFLSLLKAQLYATAYKEKYLAVDKLNEIKETYRNVLNEWQWQDFNYYLRSQMATYLFADKRYNASADVAYSLLSDQIDNNCNWLALQNIEVIAMDCLEMNRAIEIDRLSETDSAKSSLEADRLKSKTLVILGQEYLNLAAKIASNRQDWQQLIFIDNIRAKYGIK